MPAPKPQTYAEALTAAETCGVMYLTAQQFEEMATFAGWKGRTIELFLKEPRYSGAVLLEGSAVRILSE